MNWWEELRLEFPVTEKCTYMDAAYDCGGSYIGKSAAGKYFDDWADAAVHGERGGPGRARFFKVADETRGYLAQLLGGVEAKNITITKNTNEGINMIVQGFDFKPGDNMVIMDKEYTSIVLPCINAVEMRGVECKIGNAGQYNKSTVDMIWEYVDDKTVMIFASHVQSVTGYKLDIKELGRRCKQKNIFLIVDAVQSLGLNECNAKEWGISAVSGAGYKGLCAFISIGYLYCCDELLKRVRPVFVSDNFFLKADITGKRPKVVCSDECDASKLDNASSNLLGAYILHDSLKRILEIGIDKISERISMLYDRLYIGLKELGYNIITPQNSENRCATITIISDKCKNIVQYFYENGVVISGSSVVRISIAAFTNEEDIENTLRVAGKCPVR